VSAPLSEQQLAEIRARAEAATEGPWDPCPGMSPTFYGNIQGEYLRGVGDIAFGVGEQAEADLAFVLHAREDVPALLAEVDRLRAERAETNASLDNAVKTIREQRDRITKLENALAATGRSLSSFIFDSSDPGADALGAQWLYHQVMPQADDPFAQPRAFRASVLEEAAKAAEKLDGPSDQDHRERPQAYLDGYSDGVQDAAERVNKLADEAAEGGERS
jgi:hypothetical protein